MRNRSITIALGVLLATTGLSTAGQAQTYQPMERQAADENGVDVISGKVTIPLKTISIGSGDSTLTYSKGFAAGQPWDTFDVQIFSSGAGQPTLVTLFGDQRRFTGSAPNWANADGDGGMLTSNASSYTYTARDGTVFLFLTSLGDTSGSVKARVSTITRPNGEVWTYHYKTLSGVKRVQSVTTNQGFQLKALYASNVAGPDFTKLAQVTVLNNAVEYCNPTADSCSFTQLWRDLNFSFSTSGSTTTENVADDLNNTIKVDYTLNGPTSFQPASSTAPAVTFTYYGDGRVQSLSEGGGTWGYSYADNGNQRTTTVTQPLGGSKIYVSDLGLKRILSFTDELNRTISYQYDSLGRQTRATQPDGNYIHLTYDARGNVTETRAVDKPSTSLADIVSTASFPVSCTNPKTCNQPTSETDPRLNTTSYTYDPNHGGILTSTSPPPTAGATQPQIRYGYTSLYAWYKNAAGTVVQALSPVTKLTAISQCQTLASCTGGADETKTSLIRGVPGVANNLLVTSSSAGAGNGSLTATTTSAYDNFGSPRIVDGPLAGSVDRLDYMYDEVGRLFTVEIGPDGAGATRKVSYQRDEDGRVKQVNNVGRGGFPIPSMNIISIGLTYDALGRVTQRRLTSGAFANQLTHSVTHYTYDIKGRVQCENVRMNPSNFTSVSPSCTLSTAGSFGPDRITRFEYDNADQLTVKKVAYLTSDAADELTLTYTANGLLQTLEDAEDNKTTYLYDGHDRLSRTQFPVSTKGANQSNPNDYEELAYDPNGNVTSRRLRDGTSIAFTYDTLNRSTLKSLPGSEPDVTYGYDNLGRLTSAIQTGHNQTFTYDALSRNLTQTGPHGTVASQWDIGGRRTRLTYPDGFYVDYDYDGAGRLWHLRENGAASGVGVLATFAYDGHDRRSAMTQGNGAIISYSHDRAGLLATLGHDFPGTSNDQSATFSYNPAEQIVSVSRTNDAYAWTGHFNENKNGTANGLNQLTQVGTKSLTHDGRGNVTAFGTKSFTYSSENLMLTGPGGTSLSYDPAMRLYQTVSGALTTRLAYDGLDRILEYNGNNAIQRRYLFGPSMDEPLVWYEGSGTTNRRFLGADERGSVITVTDSAGAILNINKYDEYGQPQSTNLGNFGYTGQAWLPSVGEWYYKARDFNAELGRFLQTDPTDISGGINLYAYVGNDPINWVDPLGLQPWTEDEHPPIVVRGGLDPAGRGGRGGGVLLRGFPSLSKRIEILKDEYSCPLARQIGTGTKTPNEAALESPLDAINARNSGRAALGEAERRFPSQALRWVRDAYRHFAWNYDMTNIFGSSQASDFANAYENERVNSAAEQRMDLHHNLLGRTMAADPRFSGIGHADAFDIALAAGCVQLNPSSPKN